MAKVKRIVEFDDVVGAVGDDIRSGEANAIPLLIALADAKFKGNWWQERAADWATSHTGADLYRDAIRWLHALLSARVVEIEVDAKEVAHGEGL